MLLLFAVDLDLNFLLLSSTALFDSGGESAFLATAAEHDLGSPGVCGRPRGSDAFSAVVTRVALKGALGAVGLDTHPCSARPQAVYPWMLSALRLGLPHAVSVSDLPGMPSCFLPGPAQTLPCDVISCFTPPAPLPHPEPLAVPFLFSPEKTKQNRNTCL